MQVGRDVIEQLRRLVRQQGSLLVAFSGGVDSTVVLAAAMRALPPDAVLAAIADSPSLARDELERAREVAGSLGARLEIVATDELSDPGYVANAGNRCYFCKHTVLSRLGELATRRGMAHVATGTHADDRKSPHRPGLQAARELSVIEPLAEAGLTKDSVRELARHWQLPVAEKPAMPCLSSRLAVGVPVSIEALGVVERAESAARRFLADSQISVYDLRVRVLDEQVRDFRVELDEQAYAEVSEALGAALVEAVAEVGLPGSGSLAPYRSGALSTG